MSNELLKEAFGPTQTEYGSSRWKEYRTCGYAHHLRYVEGVQLIERPVYFELGSLVHAVLGYLHLSVIAGRDLPDHELPDYALALQEALDYAEERGYSLTTLDQVGNLLTRYLGHWKSPATWPGHEILGVEVPVQLKLWDDSEPYTSRVDLVLRELSGTDEPGQIVLVDHKTRSSGVWAMTANEETVVDKLRDFCLKSAVNPQFMGSSYAARETYGLDYYPAMIVNVLVKTQVPSFLRATVRFTDKAMRQWVEAQEAWVRDSWHDKRRNYDACSPPIGQPCWAFEHCHGTGKGYTARKPWKGATDAEK